MESKENLMRAVAILSDAEMIDEDTESIILNKIMEICK